MPDWSENSLGDLLDDMRAQLATLDALPAEPLTDAQRIDRRLASGFLKIQCWEIESGRFYQANPGLYAGEAVFGVMSLFLNSPLTPNERAAFATERMSSIPRLLEQARENIRETPLPWARHALDECKGARRFFGDDAVEAANGAADRAYRVAVGKAARAFAEFGDFLGSQVREAHSSPVGCGEEALQLHLEQAHCLADSPQEIAGYARSELREAQARLQSQCAALGETEPAAVVAALDDLHPDIDGYYDRYKEFWNEIRSLAADNALLTWPDFPIRYVPQPRWARRAAPHLYFLNYRAPAAFDRPAVHEYFAPPIDRSRDPSGVEASLRANNDSVIKLNHVVHHGGIGHHVQNWWASRAGSRIGQIAAVDCASRIAMNCGGTMAEGWACYATDLVGEFGGLTALETIAEVHTRTRMCTRAIVDLGFHLGELSFEDAVATYMKEAGMSRDAATYETTRNSMFPGSAVMYLTGCDGIHRLRKEVAGTMGSDFSLRDFHDRFLSHGSVPVALIADAMTGKHNREAQDGRD